MTRKHVILVAGGSGKRFGGSTPKQFLLLNGKPILAHAMECFYAYDSNIKLIIALHQDVISEWATIAKRYSITVPHSVATGGETRFHSVQNALRSINGSGLVAVHDGVRPLVNRATIAACFDEAERSGAAIPVAPIADSIRQMTASGSVAVHREDFCAVQTPQVFQVDVLLKAYEQAYREAFTDDASVVESAGFKVSLVAGNIENIKITTPVDLIFAEATIKNGKEI